MEDDPVRDFFVNIVETAAVRSLSTRGIELSHWSVAVAKNIPPSASACERWGGLGRPKPAKWQIVAETTNG